jgi:hypothetical protein
MRRFILAAQSEPLALIEVPNHKKTSFRPSKLPRKFGNATNSKFLTNCFEPFGVGGWPPISTWINPPSLVRNGLHLLALDQVLWILGHV